MRRAAEYSRHSRSHPGSRQSIPSIRTSSSPPPPPPGGIIRSGHDDQTARLRDGHREQTAFVRRSCPSQSGRLSSTQHSSGNRSAGRLGGSRSRSAEQQHSPVVLRYRLPSLYRSWRLWRHCRRRVVVMIRPIDPRAHYFGKRSCSRQQQPQQPFELLTIHLQGNWFLVFRFSRHIFFLFWFFSLLNRSD